MTQPDPADPTGERAEVTAHDVRLSRLERRRERVVQEILRNRRAEYRVPTWVLSMTLLLIIAAWVTLILLS